MKPLQRNEIATLEDCRNLENRDGIRYELVGGRPRAMVGGTQAHDRISLNILTRLDTALAGKPCRTNTSNMRVRIPNGNYRYPDASVDCSPMRPNSLYVEAPVLIVEVLSESTRFFDESDKLEEYESIAAMRHVLLVSQDEVRAHLFSWTDGVWPAWPRRFFNLDDVLDLETIGVTLAMRDIYANMPQGWPVAQNEISSSSWGRLQASARLENSVGPAIVWERAAPRLQTCLPDLQHGSDHSRRRIRQSEYGGPVHRGADPGS
jgi:Uma2 family endonuclease